MEYKTILNNTNKTLSSYDNRPLAFFDSGVGGLTVLKRVKELLPDEITLYFGDTKHMPYGEKTEAQLIEYADNIFKFFEKKNAKAVIMACNTTSAVTYEKLKNNYNFKIYPIIQSVCSAIAKLNGITRLGIIATPATVNSHAYKNEIKKYNPDIEVFEIAAPDWVKIVEANKINETESINKVKEILDNINTFHPDKIILACTHYPYLMKILTKFIPENKFIDPAIYFAQIIKNDMEQCCLTSKNQTGNEFFFVSSSPENFIKSSEMFYKLNKLPDLISFDTKVDLYPSLQQTG